MSICILQGQPVDKVDCKSCFFLAAIVRRIFLFLLNQKKTYTLIRLTLGMNNFISKYGPPLLFHQTLVSTYHYFNIVL